MASNPLPSGKRLFTNFLILFESIDSLNLMCGDNSNPIFFQFSSYINSTSFEFKSISMIPTRSLLQKNINIMFHLFFPSNWI